MKKTVFGLMWAIWFAGGAAVISAQTDIRQTDFKNFTFEPTCTALEGGKPEKVTVKDGKFSEEKKVDDYTENFYFGVTDITYGDVNGDKQDDAIVLTVCNTGGTGNFSEGFVYMTANGKMSLLTRIEGGDRAYGGLRSARVEDNLLVVERNDVGENGGACCPEFAETTKYDWKNGKLAVVGKPVKSELYPASRVAFDKGVTSSQMTTSVPAYDFKRFVVGARAGQTLTVTSDLKDVSVTLFKGEAKEAEISNGLKAKLMKNGDFVFDVSNSAETERKISFKVEIK